MAHTSFTLYTIGQSRRNTVRIERREDGRLEVILTENGGQYNRVCADVAGVVEYLGQMWGYGALADMPATEMSQRVQKRLKLAVGTCLFGDERKPYARASGQRRRNPN